MAKKIVKKAKSTPAKKAARPKVTAKKIAAKPIKKKIVKGYGAKDLDFFKKLILA